VVRNEPHLPGVVRVATLTTPYGTAGRVAFRVDRLGSAGANELEVCWEGACHHVGKEVLEGSTLIIGHAVPTKGPELDTAQLIHSAIPFWA
jgi:hypothetical protein